MRFKMLLFLCAVLYYPACNHSYCDDHGLSFTLSTEKNSYYEEEEIAIKLVIENISAEDRGIEMQYLEPVERRCLFAGDFFRLIVEFRGSIIQGFTNHMPPEPKPLILPVLIKPGEKDVWEIPFTYYYYPLNLPGQFRVKLQYRGVTSNEVVFDVKESPGTPEDGSLNINPGFSQGRDYPYGWKVSDKRTVHDTENNLLVFNLDKNTAEGEGLWVYSLFFGIESPSKLRLQVNMQSFAPEVIIFVEGWGLVKGRKRLVERNECFVTSGTDWEKNSFDVIFKKPEVRWGRIKVFSYLNPGTVSFDRVSLSKK